MNALVEVPAAPKAITEANVIAGAPLKSMVPTTLEGAWRMAQLLSASPFTPKDMKDPQACAAAILFGLDLGVTPIQAVQSIAVINGRPSIWGDLALALVRADARCEDVEETIAGEGDKRQATCIAKRKGSKPTIRTFNVDDAKKAGLWNKSGPWQQYPSRMLQLRARAFALRDAFPDILKGIGIREEVEDIQVRDASPAPPPPPAEMTAPEPPKNSESAPAAPLQEADAAGASASIPQHEDAPAVPAEDAIDPEAELTSLDDKLGFAKTADDVEGWYAETDIEAVLADFDGMVERARGIRDEHLRRVERQSEAAPSAPAAEQTSDDVPPPPADDAPAAPPAEDMSTPAAYESLVKAKLSAAADFKAYEEVRAWWSTTRPVRHGLGITAHEDIARLQAYFGARKDEIEKAGA